MRDLTKAIILIACVVLFLVSIIVYNAFQEREYIDHEYIGKLATIQYDRYGFGNNADTILRFYDGFTVTIKGEHVYRIDAELKVTWRTLKTTPFNPDRLIKLDLKVVVLGS